MIYKFVCLKTTLAFLQTLCLSPHTASSHEELMAIGCPLDAVYQESPKSLTGACGGWEPLYREPTSLKPYEWEWAEGEWRRYIGKTRAMKRVHYLGGAKHDSDERKLGID